MSWYLQGGTPNKVTPGLLYPHSMHVCPNSDFVSGDFCYSLAPAETLGDHSFALASIPGAHAPCAKGQP